MNHHSNNETPQPWELRYATPWGVMRSVIALILAGLFALTTLREIVRVYSEAANAQRMGERITAAVQKQVQARMRVAELDAAQDAELARHAADQERENTATMARLEAEMEREIAAQHAKHAKEALPEQPY